MYLPICYLFIYFCGTENGTQGLRLAKQVLYHLSHTPCPFFYLSYFSGKILWDFFCPGPASDADLLDLYLLSSWDDRHEPLCPAPGDS
jgi:hypothetical protein